jgi:hypothetical protein
MFLKIVKYATYLFLFLFLVGFLSNTPELFMKFLFFVKILLACYLLYRFSFHTTFNKLDRKIVYSSALFILLTSFIEYVNYILEWLRRKIMVYTGPMVNAIKESKI